MRWFAHLSNGEVVAEADQPGEESTWRRLMDRCARRGLYLRNLCLVAGGIPSWCKPNAEGYWQACLAFATLGGAAASGEEEGGGLQLHAKGVGWAEGGLLFTIWADAAGRIWREPPRPTMGQRQIIWVPTVRRRRGGADERLVIQDGLALRESDGEKVRLPEASILKPAVGLVAGR